MRIADEANFMAPYVYCISDCLDCPHSVVLAIYRNKLPTYYMETQLSIRIIVKVTFVFLSSLQLYLANGCFRCFVSAMVVQLFLLRTWTDTLLPIRALSRSRTGRRIRHFTKFCTHDLQHDIGRNFVCAIYDDLHYDDDEIRERCNHEIRFFPKRNI